nr:hypothetical protein Iba_chr07cCG2650 [Ipomoea batatas]
MFQILYLEMPLPSFCLGNVCSRSLMPRLRLLFGTVHKDCMLPNLNLLAEMSVWTNWSVSEKHSFRIYFLMSLQKACSGSIQESLWRKTYQELSPY